MTLESKSRGAMWVLLITLVLCYVAMLVGGWILSLVVPGDEETEVQK